MIKTLTQTQKVTYLKTPLGQPRLSDCVRGKIFSNIYENRVKDDKHFFFEILTSSRKEIKSKLWGIIGHAHNDQGHTS